MIRIRVDQELAVAAYVAAALRSERAHRSLRGRAKGLAGSMPKIDQEAIASTVLPLPSEDEQRRIVEAVNVHRDAERRLDDSLLAQERRQVSLRRALLDAAFSGRLTGRSVDAEIVEELAGAGV